MTYKVWRPLFSTSLVKLVKNGLICVLERSVVSTSETTFFLATSLGFGQRFLPWTVFCPRSRLSVLLRHTTVFEDAETSDTVDVWVVVVETGSFSVRK